MRLVVARCEVNYTGRGSTHLPEGTRLLMIKEDGAVMLWSDGGGLSVKPLNWMTPPTVFEQGGDTIVVRKRAGRSEDRLEIKLLEVLSDVTHDMGEAAGLQKDGVERDLQLLLADQPEQIDEGLRLVKREWPTEVGPVDLMCRDADDGWVAVEIKRIGTIDAVEQLSRYLDCIRVDPARTACRGVLVAQSIKPQAVALAESRGIGCVEVDLELLRGERKAELTLFAT
jgi:RecB family endonuclease NucS